MTDRMPIKSDFVVAHATAGRARLRKREASNIDLAQAAEAACSLPFVRKVRFAELTGSLIVEHDYDSVDELRTAMASERGIRIASEHTSDAYRPASVKQVANDVDRAVARLSGGEFDLNSLFSATLLGLGLLQFGHGKVLPAGLTLILQANSYFRPPPVPRHPAAEPR